MTIILPNEDVNLSTIQNKIDASLLNAIYNSSTFKVNVELPKFKLESQFEVFLRVNVSNQN